MDVQNSWEVVLQFELWERESNWGSSSRVWGSRRMLAVGQLLYQLLCWQVDNVDNDNNDDHVGNFALCVREQEEDAGGWSTLIWNNHLFDNNKN